MNDNQTPSSSDDLASQALAEAEAAGSTAASPKTNPQVAETLISLQNVIERNALELDTVMAEMKEFRDSLKSIFENDTTLSEVEDEAEKVTQKVKERKTQIQNTLEVNQLKNNIAELKERQKEIEEA